MLLNRFPIHQHRIKSHFITAIQTITGIVTISLAGLKWAWWSNWWVGISSVRGLVQNQQAKALQGAETIQIHGGFSGRGHYQRHSEPNVRWLECGILLFTMTASGGRSTRNFDLTRYGKFTVYNNPLRVYISTIQRWSQSWCPSQYKDVILPVWGSAC